MPINLKNPCDIGSACSLCELNQIAKIVEANQEAILEAWHDYFDP